MAIFKGFQIALDLSYALGFKKKLELRKKIVENGGTISFIVTKKCHFVITNDHEKCQISTMCKMALKYGLPVLKLEYIWDCLKSEKLLPKESYIVGGKSKFLDFKSGKIAVSNQPEKPKLFASKSKFNPKSVKIWNYGDKTQPFYDEESYEVAKYCIFFGYNKLAKSEVAHIIELHSSCVNVQSSDDNKENQNAQLNLLFRIVYQHGSIKDLKAGNICHTDFRYVQLAEHAQECYAMLYDELEKKGDLVKQCVPKRGLGSQKLQKLIAQSSSKDLGCPEEVKELVEHIWQEAMSEVTTIIGDLTSIKIEQVEKAEAVLVKIQEALKSSSSVSKIQSLISEFYSLLKHRNENSEIKESERKKWCIKKLDMCQLIKDMISVNEMTNFQSRPFTEAKYTALRCQITPLSGDRRQEIETFVRISMANPTPELQIMNVFEVWRQVEDIDFRSDIEPKRLLFHSSKMENFVGILSRGLLLPKVVVDEMGGSRTDEGSLGCGIYFASDANTSLQYSSPSKTKGSFLCLINEVALGNIKDYTVHETNLIAPPSGYNSTHGVSKYVDNSSVFKNDEYVVYNVNQQRLRYLVEFNLKGANIRPVVDTSDMDSNILCEAIEITSISDVCDVLDPMLKVKPGLVGSKDAQVQLKGVHIRAKLIDLAAQVVVLQEYHNDSSESIEAKYVFPLDDAAAVCGFEAFINGKHIVGEVKEKEVAHKEYKEAIIQGHGAYLMDQDEETPDVFTVSVGNLPSGACVLIKITYVAELQVEDELISFRLPATVAPWKEDSALKYSTQEELKSHKMKASATTVQVAVEMPFEIRSLQCTTHKIYLKQTSTKAYVEMAPYQNFGSGFQLLIGLAEIHVPRMWVERLPDTQDQACMLTFFPEFEANEVTDGEVILLLDTSNSMKGSALTEAKKIALLILKCLPSTWHFNVVTFGSDYEEVFSAPRINNQGHLETANSFIQNCTASNGNTDVILPLRPLFLLPYQKCQRNVFLITDGHINSEDVVLHSASKNSSHTRIFTFGVSDICNSYGLKSLARVSGGTFEFFNNKAKSKWESKVKNQLNKASQPGLTSISVEWRQYDDNLPTPVQAPRQITAMFNGSRQVIYGFVPNCSMATLSANVDGHQASTVVSTSELSITEGHIVHRLTARAVIRDWEDGVLSTDRTGHEIAKMDQKNYIIKLSKEYSIVTQFTSFIAVEKREENEKENLPSGPTIRELLENENVDILPYMSWTKANADDNVSIELLLEQVKQDINYGAFSNKINSSLETIEMKFQTMKEKFGPGHKDILQNAKLLLEICQSLNDKTKVTELALEIFNESVDQVNSKTGCVDSYPEVVTGLCEMRSKLLKLNDVEHRLKPITSIPKCDERFFTVITQTGKSLTLPASTSITVLDFKSIVQEMEGVPPEQQKLRCNGVYLEDEDLLEKNVAYGDHLDLFLKLRGGGSFNGIGVQNVGTREEDSFENSALDQEFEEDCFLWESLLDGDDDDDDVECCCISVEAYQSKSAVHEKFDEINEQSNKQKHGNSLRHLEESNSLGHLSIKERKKSKRSRIPEVACDVAESLKDMYPVSDKEKRKIVHSKPLRRSHGMLSEWGNWNKPQADMPPTHWNKPQADMPPTHWNKPQADMPPTHWNKPQADMPPTHWNKPQADMPPTHWNKPQADMPPTHWNKPQADMPPTHWNKSQADMPPTPPPPPLPLQPLSATDQHSLYVKHRPLPTTYQFKACSASPSSPTAGESTHWSPPPPKTPPRYSLLIKPLPPPPPTLSHRIKDIYENRRYVDCDFPVESCLDDVFDYTSEDHLKSAPLSGASYASGISSQAIFDSTNDDRIQSAFPFDVSSIPCSALQVGNLGTEIKKIKKSYPFKMKIPEHVPLESFDRFCRVQHCYSQQKQALKKSSEVKLQNAQKPFGIEPVFSDIRDIRNIQQKLSSQNLDKLLKCQLNDGSWELNSNLDDIIGIHSNTCIQILYNCGLKSLGKDAEEIIKRHLATLLVLFSILELFRSEIDLEFLLSFRFQKIEIYMESNKEALRINGFLENQITRTVEAATKAFHACQKFDAMYPVAHSTLELGPSWYHVMFNMMHS